MDSCNTNDAFNFEDSINTCSGASEINVPPTDFNSSHIDGCNETLTEIKTESKKCPRY